MQWITRERPKIDRLACPWLIRRFIDKDAHIHFVPFEEVLIKSKELDAIPFDIPDVEFTHYRDQCTFDYFVKKYQLDEPPILAIADIVRAADLDQYNGVPQAAGLWAITSGLSHNITNDHELLEIGMVLYDALYSWAKFHKNERHTENPKEVLLLEVYRKFLNQKKQEQRVPEWVGELRNLIQDNIDSDLTLSLQEVSKSLEVHPAYLSREFSKYFDNQNFGDYLRKLRIDRAIKLMRETDYNMAEVAYLTGFSDQSHFTRIFKKLWGMSPSAYKKSKIKPEKSKIDPKRK